MVETRRSRSERAVVRRLESIDVFCRQPDLCARQLFEALAMFAFCCIVGTISGVALVAALVGSVEAGGRVALGLNVLVVGLSAGVAGALAARAFFYYALLYAPEALQDSLQARLLSLRQGRRPEAPPHFADPRPVPSLPPTRLVTAKAPQTTPG